jgi:hypothetical protein
MYRKIIVGFGRFALISYRDPVHTESTVCRVDQWDSESS